MPPGVRQASWTSNSEAITTRLEPLAAATTSATAMYRKQSLTSFTASPSGADQSLCHAPRRSERTSTRSTSRRRAASASTWARRGVACSTLPSRGEVVLTSTGGVSTSVSRPRCTSESRPPLKHSAGGPDPARWGSGSSGGPASTSSVQRRPSVPPRAATAARCAAIIRSQNSRSPGSSATGSTTRRGAIRVHWGCRQISPTRHHSEGAIACGSTDSGNSSLKCVRR